MRGAEDFVAGNQNYVIAGHRSSMAFMISSAQRTASAIAPIVAGTLFPPSNCANLRAARILDAINSTRLRPSSTQRVCILFVIRVLGWGKLHLWSTPVVFPFYRGYDVLRQSSAARKAL